MVVWELDRLYRRPMELEYFVDLADDKHVALASIGGDADLSTDNGRLFARIKGAVAHLCGVASNQRNFTDPSGGLVSA